MMVTTPSSLLHRLSEPDAGPHWERFVTLYTPLLYSWTLRLRIPPEDAADLLQDLFTCLLEQLPSFTYDPARSFRAWMRTLLVNRWRTWQRRRTAQRLVPGGAGRVEAASAPEQAPEFEAEEYRRRLLARRAQP